MLREININLDEELCEEVEEILGEIGLDFQPVVKMLFTRIKKEQSIEFLLSNKSKKVEESFIEREDESTSEKRLITLNTVKREPVYSNSDEVEMTKSKAIRLFSNIGARVTRTVTFASKNRSAYNYWANPNFNVLKEDWSLILNDKPNRKLYLFIIPANSISHYELTARSDNKNLIDLQIMYNDITFTDNRRNCSFKKYYVDSIDY